MVSHSGSPESLEEFARSFFYGSRSDLLFKFLKNLPPAEAAEFFSELLEKLGRTVDDGDPDRLLDHVYEWQVRGYTPPAGSKRPWCYDEAPFTALGRSLTECRLAVIASSGHFVAGDDPRPFGVEAMSQREAEERIGEFIRSAPQLSAIPVDTPRELIRVRHPGYDVRAAQVDPEVVLPLACLRDLEAKGVIGELAPQAWSFVGASAQGRVRQQAVAWVDLLREHAVDAVLLVPV